MCLVSPGKIHIFFIGDSRGGGGATVPCYTFLESSRRANVTPHLTCNAATYRLRDIRGQNLEFWGFFLGGGYPQRGKDLSVTHIYHHVKFHTDRCHCRRDISNRTHMYIQEWQQIWYQTKRVVFVDNYKLIMMQFLRGRATMNHESVFLFPPSENLSPRNLRLR